ncbi:hypothetical protein [Bacteroides phage LoVEphage]|nr:hypothetical protein [Bacteroides phage LoVEphage]UBU95399.1 MAG: hypothetical protein [Bacteroides phage LoVEphage]UBU95465.1 MAG: hypothetical protein [Bacteroides phage LoVEphage]UBU95589.1 MAG: hypothetical protein [Bacteroides phage LoVEphage]UYE98337.1 MAG: hypothetical protein [Bacteroides phage R001]
MFPSAFRWIVGRSFLAVTASCEARVYISFKVSIQLRMYL